MNIKRVLLMLLTLGLLGSALPASGTPSVSLVGSGSDTTYDVMRRLGDLYSRAPRSENPNGDRVRNPGSLRLGSSVGLEQLCSQDEEGTPRVDFARSSREPRLPGEEDEPDCEALKFVNFAREGIVPINFRELPGSPANGVESLTVEQLTDIFVTCEITNWSQVGGSDGEIIVYTAQAGSGTRATFDQFVGGDSSSCTTPDRVIFENDVQPIVDSGEAENAIFYLSFGRFQVLAPTNVAQIAVNGVTATPENIEDESYPFVRRLFNVYSRLPADETGVPNARARAAFRFLGPKGFICDPETRRYEKRVERIIRQEGFVPAEPCRGVNT